MEETIIKYIIDEIYGGREDLEICPEDDLLGSGLIESMAMMRLIQFIEDSFDLKVEPKEMTIENFIDVNSMVVYIENKKS